MVIPDNNRPSSNKRVALFWLIMAVGNMLWSGIPHLLMLLKTDDKPTTQSHHSINTTHYPPFSRLGKCTALKDLMFRNCDGRGHMDKGLRCYVLTCRKALVRKTECASQSWSII